MKILLTALLMTPALSLVTPLETADAANCVMAGEFSNVDNNDTRAHVEVVIFDDYSGVLVDAWTADGQNWKWKTYAGCDGDHTGSIVYNRDAGSDAPLRVYSKAWG